MNESLSFEDKLKLESWGLPKYIQLMYEKKGIKQMFPWQVECLSIDGVLDGKNLIYSAPTSAGKTLVAEILCLQSVLEKKKKAVIILPFVSVVREKMFYFQEILSEAGVRVEGFMGSYHPPGGFKSVHIAICTIEKANNLINRLMEEEELSEIGCIVVDELHMLGDPHRGYLLELLLTKLKFISKKAAGVNIQIVGMSATLPNLDVVAKWLDAALYKTDFRPIPLQEYLKIDKALYSATSGYLHDIQPSFTIKNDPGDVIYLCIDTILMGYSILVFCPTKSWCESLAQQISAEIRQLGMDSSSDLAQALRSQLNSEGIVDILERLRRCPAGLDPSLGRSIAFGVSFHHAGLTMDERDIVEGSFKEGLIRVLVATTTLSSGVNLPARRVLVRSPLFNSRPLDVLTYKQMVGRAGRMGRDTEGESFLICSDKDKECGRNLISSDLPPVSSCLALSDLSASLTRAILEVIASGVAETKKEIEEYAACTLVHTCDPESLVVPLATCLSYLETNEFTRYLQDGSIAPSPLAQATLSASLYPHQAVKLLQELHKASSSFILNNHLHAIYQVTPYSVSDQWTVDWVKMFNAWEKLSPDMKAVGYLVGVEESFLVRAMRTNVNTDNNMKKLSIHRRFYTALALQDLINEVPLCTISEKFSCNKGMLQSLQQSASTFAGMVTRFCERLGWSGLEAILEQLSSRIEYGAQKDLLDLLRLDCFTAQVARALFSCGIKNVPELASASSRSVQYALTKLVPFLCEEMKSDHKNSKCIWVNGKSGMTEAEAAQYFIGRARRFLLEEMGVANADWKSGANADIDSIYLNSTVNPFEMSNMLDKTKRKDSISRITGPINESTPVNSAAAQNKSVLSVRKKCSTHLNIMDKDSPKSGVVVEKEMIQNSFRTSSPLALQLNREDLPYNASPIVAKKLHTDMECNERMAMQSNSKQETLPILTEVLETNKLEDLSTIKPSRLSMGDLFESFDEANFNVTPDIIIDRALQQVQNKELNSVQSPSSTSDKLIQNEILPITTEVLSEKLNSNDNDIDLNETFDRRIGNSTTRNSLDMFFDSFSFNQSGFSQAVVAISEDAPNVLEELDCNWGGESILETSLLLNNISKQYSPVSLKRKLSISGEFTLTKRRKQSIGTSVFEPTTSGLVISKKDNNVNSEKVEIKIDIGKDETPREKNRKEFKKNTVKVSSAIATSTQRYPSEGSSKTTSLNIINFELGTCSELSVIPSSDNGHVASNSDDSIVESPTEQLKLKKRTKSSSKLQVSNVIKSQEQNNHTSNVLTDLKNSSVNNSRNKNQLTGLTESYLEAAFGETFNDLTVHSIVKPKSNETNNIKKKNEITLDLTSHNKTTEKPTNFSKGKDSHLTDVKFPSNPLKRLRSKDAIIIESQDVFMTPPRDSGLGSVVSDSSPSKINGFNSPIKTFKDRQKRDSSVSPRRSKKESPNKYDKLSVVIIKTPDKSCAQAPLDTTPPKIKSESISSLHTKRVIETDGDYKNSNCDEMVKTHLNVSPERQIMSKDPQQYSSFVKTPLKININGSNNKSSSCRKSLLLNDYVAINNKTIPSNKCLLSLNNDTHGMKPELNSDEFKVNCKKSLLTNDIVSSNIFNEKPNKNKEHGDTFVNNGNELSLKKENDTNGQFQMIKKNPAADKVETLLKAQSSSTKQEMVIGYPKTNPLRTSPESSVLEVNSKQTNVKGDTPVENTNDAVNYFIINEKSATKKIPQLIFPCQSSELLRDFEEFLSNCSDLAISFDISKLNENRNRIGSKIRKQKNFDPDNSVKKFISGSMSLDGVAFYSGQDVYYVNLLCQTGLCLDVLIYLMNRTDLNLIIFDLRDKLKMLLECCGITVESHLLDPKVADWLLDPQEKAKPLMQLMKEYTDLNNVPIVNHTSCTNEVIQLWHLMLVLENKLTSNGLLHHYISVEMPLCQILVNTELTGIGFDISAGEELMKKIINTMKDLENEAYRLAQRIFNINSRNDLAKVKKVMNICADNEKDHPFLLLIRDWRKLHSLKTRNLSALMLDPKDVVHSKSDPKTATGRITMYEPDLQHIPKDFMVGDNLFSARSCFIPRQGNVFIGADYCQLELRILAHYSRDEILMTSFKNSQDVFKDIAANWNQIPLDEVDDDMRHKAKQVCYGLIYGMGHACLGEQLGISATEAATLQAEFKRQYPGVKRFIENTVTECRKKGYIKTFSHRTRSLPHINSTNPAFSKQGERQAVNSVIQGSASDIVKQALVKIETSLNEIIPERSKVISDHCASHLVLHLHDELIYEVSLKYVNTVINVIRSCMEESVELLLPLPVKVKTGNSWGLLESIT